jgi:hypothetical protein
MKFRFGLVVGLVAGYVLGTRAGYERYQQIQSTWRQLRRSEPAQRFGSEIRGFADRAGARLEQTASRGVDQLSESMGSSTNQSGSGASSKMDRMRLGHPLL